MKGDYPEYPGLNARARSSVRVWRDARRREPGVFRQPRPMVEVAVFTRNNPSQTVFPLSDTSVLVGSALCTTLRCAVAGCLTFPSRDVHAMLTEAALPWSISNGEQVNQRDCPQRVCAPTCIAVLGSRTFDACARIVSSRRTQMARLTRPTGELINRAASRVRRGASPHGAPVDEGVPRRTLSYWLQRGRGEHTTAAPASPYVDLMDALEIAEVIWHGELCQNPSLHRGRRGRLPAMQLRFPQDYGPVDAPVARWVPGERHCGG